MDLRLALIGKFLIDQRCKELVTRAGTHTLKRRVRKGLSVPSEDIGQMLSFFLILQAYDRIELLLNSVTSSLVEQTGPCNNMTVGYQWLVGANREQKPHEGSVFAVWNRRAGKE